MDEIKEYYIRAGELLAIFYALNTVDIHYENIIASSAYPMAIDLETLIHPYIDGHNSSLNKADDMKTELDWIKNSSILGIGVLPNFIVGGEDNSERSDISGFSNVKGMPYPYKSMTLSNVHTDNMQVVRDYGVMIESPNCPHLHGEIYGIDNYFGQVARGFGLAYDTILSNKDDFLNLIQESFSGIDVRILFRATNIYGRLLNTSFHPDFLSDEVSRSILLHRIGINASEEYQDLLTYEYRDLLQGEIPSFHCLTDSTEVLSNETTTKY